MNVSSVVYSADLVHLIVDLATASTARAYFSC